MIDNAEMGAVITMLNGLGDNAMTAFIVWVCVKYGVTLVGNLIFGSIFMYLLVAGSRAIFVAMKGISS